MRRLDIVGAKFGHLTVVASEEKRSNRGAQLVVCLCDCGKELTIEARSLTQATRARRSCGCEERKQRSATAKWRGATQNPSTKRAYSVWAGMLHRCNNPKRKAFGNYGARGISVCRRWLDFNNFLKDMGVPPQGKTLDRINNTLGYSKKNCRWATMATQSRNKRTNVIIELDGESHIMQDWSKLLGMSAATLSSRVSRGLPPERVLEKKNHGAVYLEFNGEVRNMSAWAKLIGVHQSTLSKRLSNGMTVSDALSLKKQTRRLMA